jgi:multidrug efflux pump subunit AcrA (membrane-fusion protein)
VTIEVSEKDYLDIFGPMAGKPANDEARKVRVTTATKKQYTGRVVYIEGRLHPSTGTARVRVEVEGKDMGLTPGFSARVDVLTGKPAPATYSPASPSILPGRAHGLLVVDADNTIRHRIVKLGAAREAGGRAHIVSGLEKGDRILLDQYLNPRRKPPAEGTRVRVVPPSERDR